MNIEIIGFMGRILSQIYFNRFGISSIIDRSIICYIFENFRWDGLTWGTQRTNVGDDTRSSATTNNQTEHHENEKSKWHRSEVYRQSERLDFSPIGTICLSDMINISLISISIDRIVMPMASWGKNWLIEKRVYVRPLFMFNRFPFIYFNSITKLVGSLSSISWRYHLYFSITYSMSRARRMP